MPWQATSNPLINYQKRFIKVRISIIKAPCKVNQLSTELINMSLNELKGLIIQRRNDSEVQIFQAIHNYDKSNEKEPSKKNYLAARTKAWKMLYKSLKKHFNLSYLMVFYQKEK